MGSKLAKLADEMLDLSNEDKDSVLFKSGIAMQIAEFALRYARSQLITLGGDGSSGDTMQKSVIDQIDIALERK